MTATLDTQRGRPGRVVATFSGGLVSYAAAKRAGATALLFADTIIEDEDTYRFLIESAADVLGVARPAVAALGLPTVESGRLGERKAMLARLRSEATDAIPGLHWIADGRTPWEVFEDERFIGNTRVDPCSKILKRRIMERWIAEGCDPADTLLVYGLDWSERHRIEGTPDKAGHRQRTIDAGWTPDYPMDRRPYLAKDDIIAGLAVVGITPPRLYTLGFPHGNCGGFCCKMGRAQARHLARTMPARYDWHAGRELAAIKAIGPTARPMLRDRSGGATTGVTLSDYRRQLDAFPLLDAEVAGHGWGCGGGCAIDDDSAEG